MPTSKDVSSTLPLHIATPLTLEADRRAVLTGALALTAFSAVGVTLGATTARAQDVPIAELSRSGGLPDVVLGNEDAAVTVIEYASMSCGHCKRFHETVYPELKKKYIDTGKIRFIFREFPLDNRAAAASMLARCLEGEKTYSMINVLFETQEDWAYVRGDPTPKLFEIAKQAGFTEESFNACLKDETQFKKLLEGRERAGKVFGVNSTPTFFINGERIQGGAALADFDKVIEPLLAKAKQG
ncbi:MAG: DsbA family protein [Pseudomonadota bacterium]